MKEDSHSSYTDSIRACGDRKTIKLKQSDTYDDKSVMDSE